MSGGDVCVASLVFRRVTLFPPGQFLWLYNRWTAIGFRTACISVWDDRLAISAGPLTHFALTVRPSHSRGKTASCASPRPLSRRGAGSTPRTPTGNHFGTASLTP